MRVAVLSYPTLFQTFGGLKMKIGRTVDALNKRGIEAKLIDTVHDCFRDYDLVHLFAPYNGNHRIVEQAKADGLPVVISTILNPPFSKRDGRRANLLSRVVGKLTNWTVTTSYQQVVTALTLADHLIALGGIERRMLIDSYGMPEHKTSIIYNGIGEEFFCATSAAFESAYSIPHPFVLHTGLMGDTKNQLGLVRALKDENVNIVLIGYSNQGSEDYLQACKREGGDRVHYLGELPHGELLASAYAAADIVAVPSRHEGMPNSILEALASDKPVVLTNNHTIDFELPTAVAAEVNSYDDRAIHDAVMRLLNHPPAPGQARSVVASLSWPAVAEKLETIYSRLLPLNESSRRT
jgi:glycosyltransferase involved in cell wall biosynthesis